MTHRTGTLRLSPAGLVAAFILLVAAAMSLAQAGDPAAPPPNSEEIIPFLNQTIVWSRQLTTEQQLVTEPSDALFLNDSRQIADQAVKLSFDFARARAKDLMAQSGGNGRQ
ncbi:MAG TPA: hypothetical protein VFT65_17820, partial [Candidatus Angelobacter sp.]|nr:hypothetical protein [Candidatus Angelobacter sp.]